jgi:hypothetical protein
MSKERWVPPVSIDRGWDAMLPTTKKNDSSAEV